MQENTDQKNSEYGHFFAAALTHISRSVPARNSKTATAGLLALKAHPWTIGKDALSKYPKIVKTVFTKS